MCQLQPSQPHKLDRHTLNCKHCCKALWYRCNHCGVVRPELHIETVTRPHPHYRRMETVQIETPDEHCPKCRALLWEVIARAATGDQKHPNTRKTRINSAMYRALIKAAGAKPGKKIVTGRPVDGSMAVEFTFTPAPTTL